jgi:3',5'-cyclic AMP phosphodiesterase CpdA
VVILVAHLSDLHFGGPPDARGRADRALDHVLSLDPAPDLLLVTGDVADHGTPEEYAEARAVLGRWPGQVLVGAGNHDVRHEFARALLGREADGPLDLALDLPAVRFLMLDSLVSAPPGERFDPGDLVDESLAWLDAQLLADARWTLVCLHHPPADLGISLMDPIRLQRPERLEAVLRAHPHHVATLVGHAHTQGATTFAGKPLLVGGGVASTVTLDQEPLPLVWEAAPPTIAFHLVHDDGRVTTHWRAI